jgi:hypothetical protein
LFGRGWGREKGQGGGRMRVEGRDEGKGGVFNKFH